MTARRARTAAIVGWALLVLAAPGLGYIVGGLVLLAWLVHDLAADADRLNTDEQAWLDTLLWLAWATPRA